MKEIYECLLLLTLWATISANTLTYETAAIAISTPTTYETAIAVKQGVHDFANPIATDVDSYEEFVKKSKIFVDNTLFIKEVLTLTMNMPLYNIAEDRYPMQMYYIGPRKRGKTLNVDMLISFLEMRTDEDGYDIEDHRKTRNYDLFVKGEIASDDGTVHKLEKPLLISKHTELIRRHLAKHPVVYVNFENVKGDNFPTVLRGICDAVNQAFLRNWHIMKRIRCLTKDRETNKRNPARYYITEINETMSDARCTAPLVPYHIHFLCEVFFKIFEKRPFVILDNFDKPITNLLRSKSFPADDVDQLLDIMDLMADTSLQRNKFRGYGFVMGEYELEQFGPYLRWSSYKLMDLAVSSHPIAKYFGFSQKDVDGLFDKLDIPAESRHQAHKWYNGYLTEGHDRRIYNTLSVSSFLNHKQIRSYWKENEEHDIINHLCQTRLDVRIELLALLSKQKVRVNIKREMGEDEITNLKSGQHYAAYEDFLWYIFRMGYLTYHSRENSAEQVTYQGGSVTAKLSNNEIASHMATWLISYYRRAYGIQENVLQEAATNLLKFVNSQCLVITTLERSLSKLYSQSAYRVLPEHKNSSSIVENPIHAILNTVVLKMQHLSLFEIDVYYNKIVSPDIVIANNHTKEALVLTIDPDESKTTENPFILAQTSKQIILKKIPYVNVVKMVAVKVSSSKTVQIKYTTA